MKKLVSNFSSINIAKYQAIHNLMITWSIIDKLRLNLKYMIRIYDL